jgi:hypothetical protein
MAQPEIVGMPRFNFDLFWPGTGAVHDHQGMIFADCRAAAHFAEGMAADLGMVRPELRDEASVVVTDERRREFMYCVAVGRGARRERGNSNAYAAL